MSNFVAGLTNVNPEITAPVYKEYPVYVQYDGILEASATASVSFQPSDVKFRYAIIQQHFAPGSNPICLTEVKVFVRGNLHDFLCRSTGFAEKFRHLYVSMLLE